MTKFIFGSLESADDPERAPEVAETSIAADETQRELEFYRRQSDELGMQVLRLQTKLMQVSRESRRNRTTATLVRALDELAHGDLSPAGLSERCLRVVIEQLSVDRAAILRRSADAGGFVIEYGLGFPAAIRARWPLVAAEASHHYRDARSMAPAVLQSLREATGLECLLWASTRASGSVALLVGNTRQDRLLHEGFEEGDQESLEAALEVYLNLLELHRAETAVRASEAKYRAIVNSVSDGIVVADVDECRIVDANDRMAEMFGYDLATLRRMTIGELNPEHAPFHAEQSYHYVTRARRGLRQVSEWHLKRHNGESIWTEVSFECADIAGTERLLVVFRDITARRRAEAQLRHDALHDTLTGLPNRTLVMDRVEQALAKSKREPDHRFALIMVDLDRFKSVNDSLGHMVGDQLLMAVSLRMLGCVRAGDTIARLGGDEFLILLDELKQGSEAACFAERLQLELMEPLKLGKHDVFTSASMGIALGRGSYRRAADMLRDAEIAMYHAKAQGHGQHELFRPNMHRHAVEQIGLENDLRRAAGEPDELCLHYQPLVNLVDGRIMGFEALVRWQHPQRGLLSPGEFIPLAEESGLIQAVGRWVLRDACEQIAAWQRRFPEGPAFSVSVNLSRRQLTQVGLVDEVQRLLEQTGCDPRCLCLEITESAIMENAAHARNALYGLRCLGIRLSMDDFGTGYSSLSFLHQFPIDVLKIDRSFIQQMETEENGHQIVATIVTLGQSLRKQVVAEGIETPEQAQALREMGCEVGQGYLFARPVAVDAATALLDSDGHLSGGSER